MLQARQQPPVLCSRAQQASQLAFRGRHALPLRCWAPAQGCTLSTTRPALVGGQTAAAGGGWDSSSGMGGGGSNGSNRRPVALGGSGDSDGDGDAAGHHHRHHHQQQQQQRPLAQLLLNLLLPGCLCQLLLAPAALAGGKQGLVSRRDEAAALPQWEIDAFVDRMWELSGPIVNNMGFSGLLGAAAAAALKFVGRTLAASVGMCLVLVQVLSYYDIITVNWSVVHEQARTVLDRTGDGRLDKDDFKRAVKKWMIVLSEGVPSVSGFLLGFLAGMRLF